MVQTRLHNEGVGAALDPRAEWTLSSPDIIGLTLLFRRPATPSEIGLALLAGNEPYRGQKSKPTGALWAKDAMRRGLVADATWRDPYKRAAYELTHEGRRVVDGFYKEKNNAGR